MVDVMEDGQGEGGMAETRRALHHDLMRFVRHGEGDFEALALRVVGYQRAALPSYGRSTCARRRSRRKTGSF
jgi:hypothetical protein